MEAENYLSSGHGLRLAIQGRAAGWKPLSQFARVWQPSRLKGIQVGPEFGTPFFAATQVFDIRPVPRKWLALSRTENAQDRFITPGTLVVTCSGAVGRATIANDTHKKTLISHDLLRVAPEDAVQAGWLYAYLLSPQARAMMTSAQYGHIIKHLEISHLNALPVPVVKETLARKFSESAAKVLDLRNRAHRLTLRAEARFARAFGSIDNHDRGESGYRLQAKELSSGRRRFEGAYHNPATGAIRRHLAKGGQGFLRLCDAGLNIWVPSRYKRIPAEKGVAYMDSAELLEICPDISKKFADCDFGDNYRGRVQDGWLLVPCSGQVYGIIGSVVMAGASLHDQVVSNHVMRIAPRTGAKLRNGYLLTALTHPTLGRPLVKALPFGSSVPEIDPIEFTNFQVVRLAPIKEEAIAALAEESARLRARADVLERAMSEEAGRLVERFVAGDMLDFVTAMPVSNASELPKPAPTALIEHSRVRLRRALSEANLPVGAAGTIVHVYRGGKGYEVEFTEGRKHPVVETLFPADVEPLTGEDE